ncbi:MAG: hypothetical protein ACYDHW_02350 [Syntrophorhabdaceae bacterium]
MMMKSKAKLWQGKKCLLKYFYMPCSIFLILLSRYAYAVELTLNEDEFSKGTGNAGDFLTSLSNMIMYGLLSISFCAGTGLIIWGFVTMANKDNNPQGAQGAWKKVAFGGCLVSLSAILGIIKSTINSAAGVGSISF